MMAKSLSGGLGSKDSVRIGSSFSWLSKGWTRLPAWLSCEDIVIVTGDEEEVIAVGDVTFEENRRARNVFCGMECSMRKTV